MIDTNALGDRLMDELQGGYTPYGILLKSSNEQILSNESKHEFMLADFLSKHDRFVGWSAYPNLAEVNKSLYDLLLAANEPDVFDLSIADRLCDYYSTHGVCSMLTDNQKELVAIGVECEQDWSSIVPPNLKMLYDEIISEQSESESIGAGMQM